MKNIVYLLSICVILLSSCNQEDTVTGPTITQENILVKEMFVSSRAGGDSGGSVQSFIYNGKKISKWHIRTVQRRIDIVYTYTGDLITGEEWLDARNGSLMKKYVYEYDANSRLEKIRYQWGAPGSSLILYKKYTYNADGTVLENNDPADQLTYYLTNGNIVKTVQVTPTSTTTLHYTYDDANSPFKNIIGFNKLILFYQNEPSVSGYFRVGNKHNIRSIVRSTGYIEYKANYTYDLLTLFPLKGLDNTYLDREMKY